MLGVHIVLFLFLQIWCIQLDFGIEKISDLPNKDELKASGFLEKRSAIATITDIASKNDLIEGQDSEEEETLADFIPEENLT